MSSLRYSQIPHHDLLTHPPAHLVARMTLDFHTHETTEPLSQLKEKLINDIEVDNFLCMYLPQLCGIARRVDIP